MVYFKKKLFSNLVMTPLWETFRTELFIPLKFYKKRDKDFW